MMSFTMKQTNVEAKLVRRAPGESLVADFRDSTPPVVWQIDLAKSRSVAVALKGRDDDWSLGLLEPRGEFSPVARFDNREDAEEAYAAVQKVLMKGHACRSHSFWRWVLAILAVGLVIYMAAQIVPTLLHSRPSSVAEATKSSYPQQGVPSPADAASQLGVPLPADEVLRNQQP